MQLTKIFWVFNLIFCLTLFGCASKPIVPDTYDASEVGKVSQVVSGEILSQRPVDITRTTNTNNSNNTLTGWMGSQSSQPPLDYNGSDKGVEYIIKLNTGNVISVVQSEDVKLKVNQRVLVIYGATTRVVADESDH